MAKLKEHHVLIVDDEPELNKFMVDILKKKGYSNVHSASDGDECLKIIEQWGEQIYAISLDLKMPTIDGFQVMQHLARTHRHIVGVVMVTGMDDVKTAMYFKQLGTDQILAVDYLTLPFDEEIWAETIGRTIAEVNARRRHRVAQPPQYLTDQALYAVCMSYAMKDTLSSLIAGLQGVSIRKVSQDIESKADKYFAKLQEKLATKSISFKITADQIKRLLSDDPSAPKP